jgi:hypothetical protein
VGSGFCDGDHFMVVTPIRFRERWSSKMPNQRAVVSLCRELPCLTDLADPRASRSRQTKAIVNCESVDRRCVRSYFRSLTTRSD